VLIPLTNANGKHTFGLNASSIWVVERDAANPLTTRVITTMMGKNGLVAYDVMESPEQVIELTNLAAGAPPSLKTPAALKLSESQ
jgi:uncharacterized protein YlzI (FlbEa/FlbD family)